MKKSLFSMLLAALLILSVVPAGVFAATDASKVVVTLKTGTASVNVNGTPTAVPTAPYVLNGTTMVPLKVITLAFNASLKLQDNKIITLNYNDKEVILTMGSTTVKVGGKAVTVANAPKIQNGTTMVPARVIVEAFGATIAQDKTTKVITITGVRAEGTGTVTIDSDAGKTKVGDSHQGWSMKYPAGLIQVNQSSNGDFVMWADAKEAAMVFVSSYPVDNELTRDEKRELIEEEMGYNETLIDKRTITVGASSFEKFVARSDDGAFYEYRGIQQGEKFYIVSIGIEGKSKDVLNAYQSLLDSFKPSFDKKDTTIKDITKVVNGLITHINKEFGLTVKLPTDWEDEGYGSMPYYASDDGEFSLTISSLVENDTAEKWLARKQSELHEDYLPAAIRNESVSTIKLKDGTAQLLKYELPQEDNSWTSVYTAFLVVGEYRYEFTYSFNSDLGIKGHNLFNKIMETVDVDTDYIASNFGQLEDENDMVDRTTTVTKKSKKYGYSITLPTYWEGDLKDFEENYIIYSFSGGEFFVSINEDETRDVTTKYYTDYIAEEGSEELKLLENTTVTLAGKTANKLVVEYTEEDEGTNTQTFYIVDHAGHSIAFGFNLNEKNATTSNLQRIEKAIQSITFN
ncbi:stalk domain-containing protein [Paenibacillus sp. GCM10023252]|uniref:stalk domain-containing protein n=1 Tax=Paenibacillus sp. GCM10023252 TaxID=3252649 RepID=UPI00361CE6B7